MKIDFQGTGTAANLELQVRDAQTAHISSATKSEQPAVQGAFQGVIDLLYGVPHDTQASVTIGGEVRTTDNDVELVHVYIDLTVVPAARVQEAKVAAETAKSAAPAESAG